MVLCISLQGHAQNNNHQRAFDEWRKNIYEDFDDFRKKIMDEYVEFVRSPWKEFEEKAPVPAPLDDPRPPVIAPIDSVPILIEDKPIVIEEVIGPLVDETPQPQPVTPIEEVPTVETKYVEFVFFGTSARVRFDINNKVFLKGLDPKSIADALTAMSTEASDNMIVDCLNLRDKHNLNDWAYLLMLEAITEAIYAKGTNEAELLLAYVYMQSGYKMRLAQDGSKLYMLYGSKHQIFNQGAYELDGDLFYSLRDLPDHLSICGAKFPNEQSLSLNIEKAMNLAESATQERVLTSGTQYGVQVRCQVNQNLIDFYNTYPTSVIGEDVCTRWAVYANTPLNEILKAKLYPQFKQQISGKSQIDAVNILLNWVQTGFEYEYDDKVWGRDRAFFAEESLYYPYCDCEDRSILFTRIVRDLLGLDCILVYYPGHMASAVCFTQSVKGEYISLNGQRFTIADPTYINAPVGFTMPDMDNQRANVILLKR